MLSLIHIYSIVNSLVELSNINKVQIAVNGNTDMIFREKISLSNAVSYTHLDVYKRQAYGDGNRKAESKVEDTDQNRKAEPNAGDTDQNREAESNAGDTDQNRKAEPSAGSTGRTELSDASSEEAKTLVVHICGAVSLSLIHI